MGSLASQPSSVDKNKRLLSQRRCKTPPTQPCALSKPATTLTLSIQKVPQELLKGRGILIAVAHLGEVVVGDDNISRIPYGVNNLG